MNAERAGGAAGRAAEAHLGIPRVSLGHEDRRTPDRILPRSGRPGLGAALDAYPWADLVDHVELMSRERPAQRGKDGALGAHLHDDRFGRDASAKAASNA